MFFHLDSLSFSGFLQLKGNLAETIQKTATKYLQTALLDSTLRITDASRFRNMSGNSTTGFSDLYIYMADLGEGPGGLKKDEIAEGRKAGREIKQNRTTTRVTAD